MVEILTSNIELKSLLSKSAKLKVKQQPAKPVQQASVFSDVGNAITQNTKPKEKQDETLALRLLMWARDVRGGAGERQIVRDILLHLEANYPDALDRVFAHIPEFGRWDDMLIFKTKRFKDKAYTMIGDALREKNGTQKEHRDLVLECKKVFSMVFPDIAEALGGSDNEWEI